MKLFGLEITRSQRSLLQPLYSPSLWTNLFNSGSTIVSEPFTGAWQRNVRLEATTLLQSSAVYACVTGIASDIGKLRIKLTENHNGIWDEVAPREKNSKEAILQKTLEKPNKYQTRQKFIEQWILSKFLAGNTYVLKERNGTDVVTAMYVLDPVRVTPLISESGDIFYELKQDYLNQVEEEMIVVPAKEIMHDSMQGIFHPLIGTSPLYACMMSAGQMNAIQNNSSSFFANKSLPGGMLTAPGKISSETAVRMKELFETNFGGANIGRLFVAGDGLKFEPLAMTAEQSLLVEQLKWSVSDVARAFHYPEFKLGGPLPPYSGNMQALLLSYYTDCLQAPIEAIEALLDEGLEVSPNQETEMDTDNLLRMDEQGRAEVISKLAGTLAPNEGRKKMNLPPVAGGDSPYLQQQNFSLEALAKRDAQEDPFASNNPAPQQAQASEPVAASRDGMTVEDLDEWEAAARREFIEVALP